MKRSGGRRAGAGERRIGGVAASPGIAIGPAHVVEDGMFSAPEYRVPASRAGREIRRFQAARDEALRQIGALAERLDVLPEAAGEELAVLLDAHRRMLSGSRLVRGVEERIRDERINAEAAVRGVVSEIADSFAALADSYMAARAQDVREVGARLIGGFAGRSAPERRKPARGSVVVAHEVSPADTALMEPGVVSGFAARSGGPEGHTAIMARSLELPAVLAVPGLTGAVRAGETVIVDGGAGLVIVNPTPGTLRAYRRELARRKRERRDFDRLRRKPAVTSDSVRIALHANVDMPRDAASAVAAGAEGVGLLRTEFMFMNRETLPEEDEQYEILSAVVKRMRGRPTTIRTFDAGGDKLAGPLVTPSGEDASPGEAANPALGLRAIRLSLARQDLLETQVAAILRAGAHGPVRILLPLVCVPDEVRRARRVVSLVMRRLRRRGVPVAAERPPVGIMIEVPGAALAADALAAVSDYFSIGTNDLTMYTLAADRAYEHVAELYNPLHPAVLRLIRFTVQAAENARIPVDVCGEIAGDPAFTPLLLGLGIRGLSMHPSALPRVKERILGLDLSAAIRRAEEIAGQTDPERASELLAEFNAAD